MPVSKKTVGQRQVNVAGAQGNRNYLKERGVIFETHNPTITEVCAVIKQLSSQRSRKPVEAAQLLTKLLERI